MSRLFYCSIAAVFLNIFSLETTGQNFTSAKNTFFVEASTKGAYYSINYDRIIRQNDNNAFTARAGFSFLPNTIAFPVGLNFLTGTGPSHLEISLVGMPLIENYRTNSDTYLYIIPGLGYRLQHADGGLFLKATVSPIVVLDPPEGDFWKMDGKVYPAASAGIGYSF